MAFLYLNDILLPLSHSLGEESIPSPVPTSRSNAVQYALNRIYRLYDFDWTRHTFTVTLTSGSGVLDSTIRTDAHMDVRNLIAGVDNDFVFEEVTPESFDTYIAGDYKYYVSIEPLTGVATIVTTETTLASLTVRASIIAPVISSVIGVTFPSAKIIADFALVNVRRYEDKDADTSVEEAIAMQGLTELIASEQRNNPPGRAKNRYEVRGHYTGEVLGDYSTRWSR